MLLGFEVRRYSERQILVKVIKRLMGNALLAHEILDDQAVMGTDAIAQVIKQPPHRQCLGNDPRFLVILRKLMLTDSMALVV